jgi:hypothetical protein
MQFGDVNLGDKGNEGKEPSPLEPRVGAVVGVERHSWGMQEDLGDEGDEEGNGPSPLGPCHSRAERPRQQAASAEKNMSGFRALALGISNLASGREAGEDRARYCGGQPSG